MRCGETVSGTRAPRISIIVAMAGAVVCTIGLLVDPERVAAAWLTAYVSCLAVVLGALAMIMIANVTAATWFVALRRQAEQVVGTMPLFAVLVIPLVLSVHLLYPWARPSGTLTPAVREAVNAKAVYLNVPFFTIRAALYLTIWIGLGEVLRRASLEQDRGTSTAIERRMRLASVAGLIAFALSVSFAAFDWMMSLTPAWYSTIYGVNYFAGGMVGGLALLTVLVARARWDDELPDSVGADHFHALAKLLLTFVLFWVYIGFSQLIVIWSAEIPAERTWYVYRMRGAWAILGSVVVAGHFAIPFCVLLVRSVKRSPIAMACIGVWLLVMHYLDIYWIVMPDTLSGSWWEFAFDAGALMLVTGLASAIWALRRAGEPAIPVGDPKIAASLEYSTE